MVSAYVFCESPRDSDISHPAKTTALGVQTHNHNDGGLVQTLEIVQFGKKRSSLSSSSNSLK